MNGSKIIDGLKEAIAGDLARVTIGDQVWVREQPNIEAAHFRDLLDQLFHSMPITNETPEHVRSLVGKLRGLVYVHGKAGVIRARDFLAKLESDCN